MPVPARQSQAAQQVSQTREFLRPRRGLRWAWWTVTEALSLHDIRDATAFVAAIAVKSPLKLSWHDDADLRESCSASSGFSLRSTNPGQALSASPVGPAPFSDCAVSTGAGNGSDARVGSSPNTFTNGHGPSSFVSTTASLPLSTALSPRGMAIARQIGTRLSEGFSETEIARELGTSSSSISQLLSELREELVVSPSRPV